MNEVIWKDVTIFLPQRVMMGNVDLPQGERLLDVLNGASVRHYESKGKFLTLSDVITYDNTGEQHEIIPHTYVNKSAIYLLATWDANLGRGIGGKSEIRSWPLVRKTPVSVSIFLPTYTLTGSIHCSKETRVKYLLDNELMFFPITNAEIKTFENAFWSDVPFVAVNKQHILSLKEEAVHLMDVRPSVNTASVLK